MKDNITTPVLTADLNNTPTPTGTDSPLPRVYVWCYRKIIKNKKGKDKTGFFWSLVE